MEAGWTERIKSAASASPAEVGLLVLVGIAIVGGSAAVFVRRSEPPAPRMEHIRAAVGAQEAARPKASQAAPKTLLVHVAGLVAAPGVYELAEGSRVKDAITAAGGARDGGDIDALNLAAPLSDGQKITVTRPGEAVPSGAEPGMSGASSSTGVAPPGGQKVNLNTATAAELDALPSIGPVLAERILAFRQQKGKFSSVSQLKDIEGIGPKKYEGMRDLVTV